MTDRLLLVKTSAFGDIVQTFYVVEDIKRARPEIEIFWCVDQRFVELAALHPAVSQVIPFPSRSWRSSVLRIQTWKQIFDWVSHLRSFKFEIALDLQGMYKSAFICWASGAPRKIGRTRFSSVEGLSNLVFNEKHDLPRIPGLASRNRAFAAKALGYDWTNLGISSGLEDDAPDGRRRVALIVGASSQQKMWPKDSWKELVQTLGADWNLDLVIVWGTEAERDLAKEIKADAPQARVTNRVMSQKELVIFFRGCRAVIGGDTGPTHLAVALKNQTLMIFSGTSPINYSHQDLKHLIPVGQFQQWPTSSEVASALRRTLNFGF